MYLSAINPHGKGDGFFDIVAESVGCVSLHWCTVAGWQAGPWDSTRPGVQCPVSPPQLTSAQWSPWCQCGAGAHGDHAGVLTLPTLIQSSQSDTDIDNSE